MDTTLKVPVAWDAMRGVPIEVHIPMPSTTQLVSDEPLTRLQRFWWPFQAIVMEAVNAMGLASHDGDAARWHANRPSLKSCPFDNACRFVK